MVLILCLGGSLTLAGPATRVADLPVRDAPVSSRYWTNVGLPRPPCLICATLDTPRIRPVRPGRLLTAFHLLFMIEQSLYAAGLPPPDDGLELRLSLVAPRSPAMIPSREWQDSEALSLYVLELTDEKVVATARQQGRGGFWGKLEVSERVHAEVNGFLTGQGSNADGAYWLATHALEVRSNHARVRGMKRTEAFGFVSLENGLARENNSFDRFAAMPGLGAGLRWTAPKLGLTMTTTTGVNAGAWFHLKGSSATPAYAFRIATVEFEL
jgi:hypothetical protein